MTRLAVAVAEVPDDVAGHADDADGIAAAEEDPAFSGLGPPSTTDAAAVIVAAAAAAVAAAVAAAPATASPAKSLGSDFASEPGPPEKSGSSPQKYRVLPDTTFFFCGGDV